MEQAPVQSPEAEARIAWVSQARCRGADPDELFVRGAAALLAAAALPVLALDRPGGTIVFSNNFQKFKLDGATQKRFQVDDITRSTIPEDFARNPRIHVCYVLRPQVAVPAHQ